MGVPALFRWLSKKYPRIVTSVEEETPRTVPGPDGTSVEVPVDTSGPNPNGEEFDCLYLDMNGIVHPCTHPEGKPAPETEEEMMVEVFAYTERVVNMVRPRKLLMMAIDGVAPRAKMNQQRSRRFRSAREAREKHEEMEQALAEWKSKGLPVSDDALENKKSWDSNAITPGTPFMDLLAASLRYWVAQKLNSDPGWKNVQVIISDASVPGEGEHKIMEHIRRQRSHPEHDPNTKHVIYGLDADLIMLSLATHEPYFKVLREDVFAQDSKPKGCHNCGKMGHIAANCTNESKPKEEAQTPASPPEKKPFIFLDVSVLREYLEIELNVTGLPFAFDLERAIDDWVFLIFFVGNDFLPHLPSLEIREGAIDTLLKIWKSQLPLMGGYLTNHGKVELARAQLILDGLASQEDEIFRKRKEDEDRREANQKRREAMMNRNGKKDDDQESNFSSVPMVQVSQKKRPANETEKPAFNGQSTQDLKEAANSNNKSYDPRRKAVILGGDNNEVVRNRNAARQANMDAAEALKAELMGEGSKPEQEEQQPPTKKAKVEADTNAENLEEVLNQDAIQNTTEITAAAETAETEETSEAPIKVEDAAAISAPPGMKRKADDLEGDDDPDAIAEKSDTVQGQSAEDAVIEDSNANADAGADAEIKAEEANGEDEEEEDDADADEDEDDTEAIDPVTTIKKRTVNPDGTVDYEDTVKMWEPGYRERYYREKFGVELSDTGFRRQVVKSYVEGLSWVLAYYYQGVPSWQWYYPYHYSPFAADFTELDTLDIKFELGAPFKPFEQLMGVLPADSRASIPPAFHPLMTESESEIIDFYPSDFEIDMNGKKMAWQGVALLPFIDEKRLLDALKEKYPLLSEDEVRRNGFGHNTLFVSDESKLYDSLCEIYAKGTANADQPAPMNATLSGGITGYIKPDPVCVPGSTFNSPLTSVQLEDILNDRSISVLYDFPEQKTPHRSVLLKGLKPPKRILSPADVDWVKRGGPDSHRGRGRGRGGGHFGNRDHHHQQRNGPHGGGQAQYGNGAGGQWNGNGNGHGHSGGYGGYGQQGGGGYANGGGGGYGGYGGYAGTNDPYAGYGAYGSGGNGGYGAQPPAGPRRDNRYAAYTSADVWEGQRAGAAGRGGGRGGAARGGGHGGNGGAGYAGLPSLGGPGPAAPTGPAAGGYGGYGGYGSAPVAPAAAGGYGGYGSGAGGYDSYGGAYGGYAAPPAPGAGGYGGYGPAAGQYNGAAYPGGAARGGGAPQRGGGRGGYGGRGGSHNSNNNNYYGGGGGTYGSFY